MKALRSFLTSAAVVVFFWTGSTALAQVTTNDVSHPNSGFGGGTARKGLPATLAPGGLDAHITLLDTPYSVSLGDIAIWATNAIQYSAIGAAGGVAGLGTNSTLDYPLAIGDIPAHPNYGGSLGLNQRVHILSAPTDPNTVNSANYAPWNDAEILGGATADDKMFRLVYGQPWGGLNSAVVDGVYMNGMSIGQGSGVSAGTFSTMINYMNYDAVARGTRTGSTPPRFIASQAILDPDGYRHAVTFTATGASFSPALPVYWARMLRVGMNVATNERGVADGAVPQNTWSDPWSGNTFRRPFTTYFGTITSWATNSDGTVPSITVDGWVVPEQNQNGWGSATGKVPGVDMLDGTSPGLDTVFTNFTSPAIMFGMYTKAFLAYSLCSLDPAQKYGDINNPNGTIGSLVHECDDERDLWNHDPADYVNSIHGYTIVEDNSGGGKLTSDSYGIGIAGGGALPLGVRVWNLLEATPAYQAISNAGTTRTNIYAPYAIGADVGDTSVLQSWGNELAKGSKNTSTLRLVQYRDVADSNAATESNEVAQANVSLHLQWHWDTSVNPLSESGAVGGQIVYNPAGYLYGLGIGAGGTFQNPNYGMIFKATGDWLAPNGGAIMNGKGLGFIPSTGDTAGHAFLYALDNYHLLLSDSAGGEGGLQVGTLTVDAGALLTAGQGLGFVPQAGDGSGHPYLMGNSNTDINLYSSAGGNGNLNLGTLMSHGGVTVDGGNGLGMVPSSGDSNGHPFFSATSNIMVNLGTSAGGDASLSLSTLLASTGVTISNGGGLGLIPTTGDSSGHVYFHGTDNSHAVLSTSAGGTGGLEVGSLVSDAPSFFHSDATVSGNFTLQTSLRLQNTPIYALNADGSNLVQWYPDATGSWRMGTSVAGGGNILGVNQYEGNYATLLDGESHFGDGGFTDPDSGVARDAKFGKNGIAVTGGTKSDSLHVTGNTTLDSQTTISAGGAVNYASANPDTNNQKVVVSIDTSDWSLYTTNVGSGASHYMVSKFDNIHVLQGLTVDGATTLTGLLDVNNDIHIDGGKSLFLYDGSGNNTYTFYSGGWIVTGSNGSQTYYGLSEPMYKETLTTPASSTSDCDAGEFTDDANYHYVCVSTNKWRRVALSDF